VKRHLTDEFEKKYGHIGFLDFLKSRTGPDRTETGRFDSVSVRFRFFFQKKKPVWLFFIVKNRTEPKMITPSIFISGTGGFEIKYNAAKNKRCFSQALRLHHPLCGLPDGKQTDYIIPFAGFRTENRQGAESFLFLQLIVVSLASICFSFYLLESRHGSEHMHQ